MDSQQQLLEKIVSFCNNSEKVSALILIGSQARLEQPADEYSDLDLIIVVDDDDDFNLSDCWLEEINRHHISFIEPAIGGHRERRVLFDNALDVDFIIIPKAGVQDAFADRIAMSILGKGYKFLVNKENYSLPAAISDNRPPYQMPSQWEFSNVVNDFFYHAVWTAKKLLRGELWAAKFCVDNYMKWKLLWMMEHYEHALNGPEYNTWYGGRFVDTWAQEYVQNKLSKTFSHYNQADMARALFETMNLFRELSLKVSDACALEYPSQADDYSSHWVREKLGGWHESQ